MNRQMRMGKYYRFLVYLVVVILVNVAGQTLFLRADLTSNGIYSLSKASSEAVGNLSEPLTINVFFTRNLPAPHNNTERYLRDLLEEYSVKSNRYFNYRFYDVSPEEGDIGEDEKHNQQLARDFGIQPGADTGRRAGRGEVQEGLHGHGLHTRRCRRQDPRDHLRQTGSSIRSLRRSRR